MSNNNPFQGLTWPQRLTFAALCLAVVSIVAWWRIGIYACTLLICVSLFKTIFSSVSSDSVHSGGVFAAAPRVRRPLFFAMLAYWGLYAVSALVSQNHAEGWYVAFIKIYLLAFPLLCLIGDTRYLTRSRIAFLFHLLTATLLLRFAVCLVISGIHLIQGTPLRTAMGWEIDPMGLHHNYLALYINIALAFLYAYWVSDRNRSETAVPRRGPKQFLPFVAAGVALVAYLLLSASRSGIVALGLMFIAAMVHLVFFRHRYKVALAVVLLSAALVAGLYIAVPSTFARFEALTHWGENYVPDDRVIAWECGLKATRGHLLLGHGSGDYRAALVESFEQRGYRRAIEQGYDSHNEYIETLMATGIVGLAFLLLMLFLPMALAFRREKRDMQTVLTVIAVATMIFFEVMLGRQMGTQSIALVYCLLILKSAAPGEMPGHEDTCQVDAPHDDGIGRQRGFDGAEEEVS